MHRRAVALVILMSSCGLIAGAQITEGPLAELQSRSELSEQDQQRLTTFVRDTIAAIAADDPVAAREAVRQLRRAYDGTTAFKRAFAEVCLRSIRSAYQKAELRPAAQMITFLGTLRVPDAQPVLLDALQDERVGVRAAAAAGLAALRETLVAAGADARKRALDALVKTGTAEKSRATLRCIYQALDYASLANPPADKQAPLAVLKLLEQRAQAYDGDDVPAMGADNLGLRIIRRSLAQFDDAERKRLLTVVGTMLRRSIEAYTSGPKRLADVRDDAGNPQAVAVRDSVEQLILIGEGLLAEMLNPPREQVPDVAEQMRNLETVEMKNEWKKWAALLQNATGQSFALRDIAEPEIDAGG